MNLLASKGIEFDFFFEVIEAWIPRNSINLPKASDRLFAVTIRFVTGIIEPKMDPVRSWFVQPEETFPEVSIVPY